MMKRLAAIALAGLLTGGYPEPRVYYSKDVLSEFVSAYRAENESALCLYGKKTILGYSVTRTKMAESESSDLSNIKIKFKSCYAPGHLAIAHRHRTGFMQQFIGFCNLSDIDENSFLNIEKKSRFWTIICDATPDSVTVATIFRQPRRTIWKTFKR